MSHVLTASLVAIDRARDFVERFVLDMAETHKQSFVQRMREQFGYPVPARREEWLPYVLTKHVVDYVEALEKLRQQLLQAEWNTEETKKLVADQPLMPQIEAMVARYGAALSRRIYASMEQQRQQTEGVTHYIWHTAGDDKVRPAHAVNDGQLFSWKNPPATGHPGEGYHCRCHAEPVKLPDDPPIEPVYPIETIILGGFARAIFKRVLAEILRRAKEPAKPAEKPVPKKPEIRDSSWKLGRHKSEQKWKNQMEKRKWTEKEITDTMKSGKKYPAPNKVNPGNEAARYEYNGKYVVRDEVTKEILQVSDENFIPN